MELKDLTPMTSPAAQYDGNSESSDPESETRPMTTSDKLLLALFCISNLNVGIFYSLLGPFFPTEAVQRDVSATLIGLIFGIYELMLVISSPFFGSYITKIGAKFMLITGIMSLGFCSLLFGFLAHCPPGPSFVVLCFVLRCMEGLGASALTTASFAIVGYAFPEKIATIYGTLEMFTGVGMMVGPPLGGWLYQEGGFRLPFLSTGIVMMLFGVLITFLLPKTQEVTAKKSGSLLGLLSSPVVCLCCLFLVCGAGLVGFIDISLSTLLKDEFKMPPYLIGLIFLVAPGTFALTSPLYGTVADKKPGSSIWMLSIGFIVGGVALSFLGPPPFISMPHQPLWMVIIGLFVFGGSTSTIVSSFQLFSQVARAKHMPETLATYGLISSTYASSFSLGGFLGPLVGGILIDKLGFEWAATTLGLGTLGLAIIALIYAIWAHHQAKRESELEKEEKQALLDST